MTRHLTPHGYDFASVDRNKRPHYPTVKASGADFVIVRDTYEGYDDPTDDRDCQAIRDAGLVFGTYMLPLPGKGHPGARQQVESYYAGAPLVRGDFPPCLDVEFPRGIAATGLTRPELLAWIVEAVEHMRRLWGVAPMIYTSKRVWDGKDSDALGLGSVAAGELADCPLWLAKYAVGYRLPEIGFEPPWPPTPAAWGEGNHWIHQEQGDAVGTPIGQADVNRFRVCAPGETGPRVRRLQKVIGMVEGTLGAYDKVMVDYVQSWQDARGLTPDAIVGPKTFAIAFGPRD